MDKYFDRSGMAIDNAKIKCIDSVKGTGEYIYRVTCNKCNGRGERNHFYKSRCIACNATGYSLVTTRTCYTLTALYRIYPEAARKISAAQAAERQRAVQSKTSAFNLWCQNHQETGGRHHAARRREQFFEQPEVDVITQISIK